MVHAGGPPRLHLRLHTHGLLFGATHSSAENFVLEECWVGGACANTGESPRRDLARLDAPPALGWSELHENIAAVAGASEKKAGTDDDEVAELADTERREKKAGSDDDEVDEHLLSRPVQDKWHLHVLAWAVPLSILAFPVIAFVLSLSGATPAEEEPETPRSDDAAATPAPPAAPAGPAPSSGEGGGLSAPPGSPRT